MTRTSRRDFLKAGATAAVFSIVPRHVLGGKGFVPPSDKVNVALIGYAFMGRAHSNAWRQVGRFLSPKLQPRLKVLCDFVMASSCSCRLGAGLLGRQDGE